MAFGGYLQANTAVDVIVGPFVDETDGKTAETGLTITQAEVRLSKNGANIAQKNEATALAHDELGNYMCKLDTTDTNTEGILTLMIHESGALPIKMDYIVLAQATYISLLTAKDTGFMDVNAKAISEDTAASDKLELLVENVLGADNKALISTDAQDLSATLDVNTKLVVGATPITLANINAEVDTALADLNLDHFIQVSSLIRNDSTVSTATVLYTELSEATADHYNNMTILFTSGILAGQARRISDYSNDATDGIVTVYPAFTDVPGDNDTFIIIPPYFYMPLAGAKEFTYTVTSGGNPVVGVEVWISTDIGGSQIVWNGTSNASGVILDVGGNKPWLDPGTYYVWKQKAGYIDDDWPDTEVHS